MSIQTLHSAFATFRSLSFRASGPSVVRTIGRIEILRTLADVEAIAQDWQALEAATPEANGFQSFAWCRAWMRASPADHDGWRIVTLREEGRLVALVPLQEERVFGTRVLRWLGEPWTQYGDMLCMTGPHRSAWLATLWQEIMSWRDADLVKMGRLRAGCVASLLPALDPAFALHCESAPFVDLRRKPRAKSKLKRLNARRRKLEDMGEVRFEIVTDRDARHALVGTAIRLKRDWLATRHLASAGLGHPYVEAMLGDLVDTEALVIGRLSVGGETAAIEIGLHGNQAFRSLLGCHDPRFAIGSPGHLLISHMIEWSRESGCRSYDLMVPADAYKTSWSNDCMTVADHAVALTWRGSLAASWYRMRPALKAAYHRMPDAMRRLPTSFAANS